METSDCDVLLMQNPAILNHASNITVTSPHGVRGHLLSSNWTDSLLWPPERPTGQKQLRADSRINHFSGIGISYNANGQTSRHYNCNHTSSPWVVHHWLSSMWLTVCSGEYLIIFTHLFNLVSISQPCYLNTRLTLQVPTYQWTVWEQNRNASLILLRALWN